LNSVVASKPDPIGVGARPTVVIRPSRALFDLDLRAVWKYRELLYFLVWRDLKVRYKQAAIGIAWAIVQPVVALAIFTVVFGRFARLPSEGVPYPLFAMAALLPWTYFSEALRRSATGLVEDSDLIRKIYFPRLVIPLAMITAPLIDLAISFVLLVALMVWFGAVPGANILFLPLFLLLALALALAVGLWLGPINVRFRDIKHTLPFVLQVWMYASPVIYSSSMIPERWRWVYSLNPMVGVIEGFRWALLATSAPDFRAMAISCVTVLLLLAGGIVYFKKMERFFADLI
jgi:lipopolysaccharide transport system permease protein